ncbi:C10 family peptidase [uncultured Microscilla sp.]|uniref:C10 family peptidase n=1 Tax=uncultured Microscilla sp. TaxID=432653 RepID=UPI002604405E|nr:C10 family peptidase [uncultured Microscilla sp.]
MKRLFTTLFMSLLLIGNLAADPIQKSTAVSVALNWLSSQNGNQRTTGAQKTVKSCEAVVYKGMTVYYLVSYNEGGYVIVSADDKAKPVLGYSETNPLDNSFQNPVIQNWMKNYKIYVYDLVKTQQKTRRTSYKAAWSRLTRNESKRIKTEVEPMMPDILYSQGRGWNAQCPEDEKGPAGRALVGCVATAMGQVMRFWEHPRQGQGSRTYNHNTYGELSADFGNTIYNWSAMSKSTADEHNAQLLYHCGVSVRMNYSGESSGAYSRDVVTALKNYFRYDRGINMIYKSRYSAEEWGNKMKEELSEGRPVLYSARSTLTTNAGHLFALDGYEVTNEGDYFHINWGWAGRSNGYFYLTEMITHGGDHNWVESNAAIIGIKPVNAAPEFTSAPAASIAANQTFVYNVTVMDADGDDVTLELTSAPAWLTLAKENGQYVLRGTPDAGQAGAAQVVIVANDGKESVEQTFSIWIKATSKMVDFETNDFTQAAFSFTDDKQWELTQAVSMAGYGVKSLTIADNQSTEVAITETFNEGAAVAFNFKVSSERSYDFLRFFIDGEEQGKWSGDINWTSISFAVPAGEHTLTWAYTKDGSQKRGDDAAYLDNIELINPQTNPAPKTAIDFETTDFSQEAFSFSGTNNDFKWEVTQVATGYAAKSQTITHNEKVSMSITKTFGENGAVFFDRKVSSEGNYDFLEFYVDGQLQEKWSGNVDWSRVNFSVAAGEHTLTWTYNKDYSVSSGDDAAWVDNIELVGVNNGSDQRLTAPTTVTTLKQNFPNPAQYSTQIGFELAEAGKVKVDVLNLSGKVVTTVLNQALEAGAHRVQLNTTGLQKGIYIYRLAVAGKVFTKTMVVK